MTYAQLHWIVFDEYRLFSNHYTKSAAVPFMRELLHFEYNNEANFISSHLCYRMTSEQWMTIQAFFQDAFDGFVAQASESPGEAGGW